MARQPCLTRQPGASALRPATTLAARVVRVEPAAVAASARSGRRTCIVFAGLIFGAAAAAIRRRSLERDGRVRRLLRCCRAWSTSSTTCADREADRLHPIKRHRPDRVRARSRPAWRWARRSCSRRVGARGGVLRSAGSSAVVGADLSGAARAVLGVAQAHRHPRRADDRDRLRAAGRTRGAVAIDVPISHWLLLLTLLLALFLALSKRRAELVAAGRRRDAATGRSSPSTARTCWIR